MPPFLLQPSPPPRSQLSYPGLQAFCPCPSAGLHPEASLEEEAWGRRGLRNFTGESTP